MDIPNDDSVANLTTTTLEENQESTTNMIEESQTKGAMYRHPNYRSILSNQATYQYREENKRQNYVPKDTKV